MKAELEARGYEVAIKEYYEPAIDPDNYYAELTAQKRWLTVSILIIVVLFLGLFGLHFLKACKVVF